MSLSSTSYDKFEMYAKNGGTLGTFSSSKSGLLVALGAVGRITFSLRPISKHSSSFSTSSAQFVDFRVNIVWPAPGPEAPSARNSVSPKVLPFIFLFFFPL